jgi:hypothetical protein
MLHLLINVMSLATSLFAPSSTLDSLQDAITILQHRHSGQTPPLPAWPAEFEANFTEVMLRLDYHFLPLSFFLPMHDE